MKLKIFNQSGQISKMLLVLAVIILIAAIIVFLVIKMAEKPARPVSEEEENVERPTYEQTLYNLKFVFESAINKGNTLFASDVKSNSYSYYKTNLTTTENFIEVKIGAKNMGKINIEEGSWSIQNIIDSEGREFVPLDDYSVSPWLPEKDLCGSLLKPAFDPTPCIKIYEVSKDSTGLKIRVITGKENDPNNFEESNNEYESALIDLIVTQ